MSGSHFLIPFAFKKNGLFECHCIITLNVAGLLQFQLLENTTKRLPSYYGEFVVKKHSHM